MACNQEERPDLALEGGRSLSADVTALVSYTIYDGELKDPIHYDVPEEYLAEQDDRERHLTLWEYTKLIFASEMNSVRTFMIMTDGVDETLASVYQMKTDPYLWTIAVDIEDSFNDDGELDTSDLNRTMVHEFAHLLSLNSEQIPVDIELIETQGDQDIFDQKKSQCETFFIQEGCTNGDAYLNVFFKRFWLSLIGEFNEIDEIKDDEERDDAKEDFYYEYQDQFVSDYAATNVTEDFAESWATFVLDDLPEIDQIKDQKVLFFYDYPELEQIRQEILENL
jgi:hypothetical protein